MKRLLLFILLSAPVFGACSVTSPGSGNTVSGVVNWTASVTSLGSAASVDWVFDDFRVIGHVTASPWSLVNYNTGWNLDGPGNVKIIVRDSLGAAICTSADVPFTTSNFGMGVAIQAGSSFSSFTCTTGALSSCPAVSGILILDINGNFGTDVQNGNDSIDGINQFSKTSPGQGGYPTGGTYRLTYDTTKLSNGPHSFGWVTNCVSSSTNCGMPNVSSNGNVPRAFVGGVFNVQNSNGTVVAVLPNITTITMAPGDTFQLSANLLTDASSSTTTTSSCGALSLSGGGARCQIVQDNACLFAIQFNSQWPSQCVAGITPLGASYTSSITPSFPNTTTLGTLQGQNFVTINSTGLMTASANVGLSYVSIIDTTSGRISQPITVEVKASKQVPHYGTCGAIYTTYHSGGACPSVLLSSLENYSAVGNPFSWPDMVTGGTTAFEGQYHQIPRNSTGTNYTTFNQWYAQWNPNFWTPIQAALTGMPNLSMVLRSDATDGFPIYRPDAIELQQGPSAPTPLGGGTYGTVTANKCGSLTVPGTVTHCDPLGFELDNLAATNRIAMHHVSDEADDPAKNLWFNFAAVYPMATADGTTRGVSQIVISGCPGACQGIFYAQGPYNQYGGNTRISGYNFAVSGATNTFLNGEWSGTTNGYYCTKWNALLQFNGTPDRRCGTFAGCTNCSAALEDTWEAAPCGIASTIPAPTAWPNTSNWGPNTCNPTTSNSGIKGGNPCDASCNGTYNVSTDAGLVVTMWGIGPCNAGGGAVGCVPGYDGEYPRNDQYSYIIGKFQAHSIPSTWCTRAIADFTTDLGYSYNPAVSDGFCSYITMGATPSQPWGRTFWEYYQVHHDTKWGLYTYSASASATCCAWRRDGKSFSSTQQGVPVVVLLGVNAETFNLGGRFPACANQMVSCANASTASNGIMTFIGAHNLPTQTGSLDDIKALVNGVQAYIAPCTGLAGCTTPTTQVLTYTKTLAPGTPSGTGTLHVLNGPYSGNTYAIPGWAGACYEIYFNSSVHLPSDVTRGTALQVTGSSGCDGTYALSSWQVAGNCLAKGYCPKLGVIVSSAAAGQTVEINDDMGVFNPLYDFNQFGNGRLNGGGYSGYTLMTTAMGYAGLKLYQGRNLSDAMGQWGSAWINDKVNGGFQQTFITAGSAEQTDLMNRWQDISQGLHIVNRLAPYYLQTMGAAPTIGPGLPWLLTFMQTSGNGNVLTTINVSEMPLTATFNLGTACQVGSNPISVYHASFPHSTTELLAGAQGNVTYTWDAGEAIVFACHASAASTVKPYSITFSLSGGAVKAIATAVHGNYSAPLASYFQTHNPASAGADRFTTCNSSPCSLNIDTGQSDVYYDLAFLDGSNNVVSTAGPIDIPLGSGTTAGGSVVPGGSLILGNSVITRAEHPSTENQATPNF